MRHTRLLAALAASGSLVLAGCARQASRVDAPYVSQNVYAGRTRDELTSERNEIVRQVNTLTAE